MPCSHTDASAFPFFKSRQFPSPHVHVQKFLCNAKLADFEANLNCVIFVVVFDVNMFCLLKILNLKKGFYAFWPHLCYMLITKWQRNFITVLSQVRLTVQSHQLFFIHWRRNILWFWNAGKSWFENRLARLKVIFF